MMKRGVSGSTSHEQYWKTSAMAQTFMDLGYNVDVIHTQNQQFIPWKRYEWLSIHGSTFNAWLHI